MSSSRRTIFFLSSVLLVVVFYAFADYFTGSFHRNNQIHEDNSKQFSLYDILSEKEKRVVENNPSSKIIGGVKINVNEAGVAELFALPGISRNVAENIVEYRVRNGTFEGPEDLLKVKGIKNKRLRTIKPFIEF